MTNWTEVNDVSTSWGQGDYPVDSLITEGMYRDWETDRKSVV